MLGSDLAAQFRYRHEVIGMDLGDIDITREDECQKAIRETNPQIVVNAAGYTNVDGCETAKEECFAVNAAAVKNRRGMPRPEYYHRSFQHGLCV